MDDAPGALCIGVTGGLIALAVALAAASVAGLALRRRAGRFRGGPARPGPDVLTGASLGGPLGEQATLDVIAALGSVIEPARGGVTVPLVSPARSASGVTARVGPHSIGSVISPTAWMLTKRRAVDFCHVATAIC